MFSGQNVQMADHLAPLLACLDRAIAHLRATHKADNPGYCLAFISNGEVLRQFHRGTAHLEWQQPIAPLVTRSLPTRRQFPCQNKPAPAAASNTDFDSSAICVPKSDDGGALARAVHIKRPDTASVTRPLAE